ncbi:MAG: hypothetical protein P8R42_20010 [Candidatus Binatia bacterium]|nr:hypothetical protein [Candidatus Binatia bacterium]
MPSRRNRLAAIAATMWLATTGLACGGGDDGCDGFVTINARPEECEIRAERFGCSTFEVDGPSCGLFGCIRCESEPAS